MRKLNYKRNTMNMSVEYTDDLNYIKVSGKGVYYIIKDGVVSTKVGIAERNVKKHVPVGKGIYGAYKHINKDDDGSNIETMDRLRKEEERNLEAFLKEDKADMRLSVEDYIRKDSSSLSSGYDGNGGEKLKEEISWVETKNGRFVYKDLETRLAEKARLEYKRIMYGTLKTLDTDSRGEKKLGGINLENLIRYLNNIHHIRELVYITKFKIRIREVKLEKFPENIMINNLKDIIMEGINNMYPYMKERMLLLLSASVKGSVAGKIWNMIPSLMYDESHMVTTLQTERESFKRNDLVEIPDEDKDFWRNIYSRRERSLGKEFAITDSNSVRLNIKSVKSGLIEKLVEVVEHHENGVVAKKYGKVGKLIHGYHIQYDTNGNVSSTKLYNLGKEVEIKE